MEKAELNQEGKFPASEALILVNKNNKKYVSCQNQNDLWIEFYKGLKQKEKETIEKLKEIK